MRSTKLLLVVGLLILLSAQLAYCENIDPYEDGSQYAYGANIGWLNAEPLGNDGPGVDVNDLKLTGYIWGGNIGWINLDPNFGGVVNDGTGRLSGHAWGQNVGWINFDPNVPGDPNHYGVTINELGKFSGWAWGQNIGWINFNSAELFDQGVRACKVAFDDLANFTDHWLSIDPASPGNLIAPTGVDEHDYAVFAWYWRGFCPNGWQLKLK